MKQTFYDYCLAANKGELLGQWDAANALGPHQVSPGSQKKVWWRCEQGHRWEARVKTRAMGTRCPYCTNRKVVPGVNDLAARHPDLAAQWHPTKNGSLTPRDLFPGSSQRVWWQCGLGHEWQARVGSRTTGDSGCPVCSGQQVLAGFNDLASTRPDLAAQWHPEKNGELSPQRVTANSNRSVWWRCDLGHEWSAPPGRRLQSGTGCPVCAGRQVLPGFNDLATVDPGIAAQWDRDRNGDLTPERVTAGSAKRVWWQCDQGHVWVARIHARTGPQRTGCPVCAGLHKKTRRRNVLESTAEEDCR